MIKKTFFQIEDYYILPKKYFFDHEYCFYLHDKLAKIVIEGEKKKIFSQTIKIKKKFLKNGKIRRGQILNLLRKNGRIKQVEKIIIKQVFVATLSDALQFIYTALKCSEKGKLSVAYANLRKPFKDNLLILELINTNKKEFFDKFKNPSKDLSIKNFKQEEKKKIIKENLKKIGYPQNLNDFIYNLRYEGNSKYGLNPLFEKANHITTNFNSFKTEKENLNFIFSNDDVKKIQWNHLYLVLPFLMKYFVDTSYSLLNREISKKIKNNLTLADLIFLRKYYPKLTKKMILKTHCSECGKTEKLDKNKLNICLKKEVYECSCGHTESIFEMIII